MNYQDLKKRGLIVSIKGKDFIKYAGLLELAHSMGLISIKTELVKLFEAGAIFKATAISKNADGIKMEFDGYGDAAPNNLNKMVAVHYIRVAETRAKASAFRDLTGIGICSLEELGGS